jgi:hypothetical protein
MKVSDGLMRQEWGPLDSEALYGPSKNDSAHYVVSLLEEYHAGYAQREHDEKLLKALYKKTVLEVSKKNKKQIEQLRKAGKPIPESTLRELGNQAVLLMNQEKSPAAPPPSFTSKNLMRIVEDAIIHNKPKILSDLAAAIKKIHGDGKRIKSRISGAGPTFKIEPNDPILLKGLELRAELKHGSKKSHFKQMVKQATGLQMGDKKAQRTLRKLGVPPSKGGRPRKHHPKNGHG